MLGGTAGTAYIGSMRSPFPPSVSLPLVVAAVLAWSHQAYAQEFPVDYGFSRPGAATLRLEGQSWRTMFNPGPIGIAPALKAGPRFAGAGLALGTGRNWFGQVEVGRRSLQPGLSLPGARRGGMLSISGGYRWGDGQSLSLELARGRGTDRLGLALSYDWPRYFVRLDYDSRLNPTPQESVRFSAGIRF
jgi:hypothetical protein